MDFYLVRRFTPSDFPLSVSFSFVFGMWPVRISCRSLECSSNDRNAKLSSVTSGKFRYALCYVYAVLLPHVF